MIQRKNKNESLITAVVSNQKGEIFDLEGYAAVGMAKDFFTPLDILNTKPIPYGTELMLLPDRRPILLNRQNGKIEILDENPYKKNEIIFPVAAFNSPGYVISHVPAYREKKGAIQLPLFSYGSVGWHKDTFRSAIIMVDKEKRQDLRFMKSEAINHGIKKMQSKFPNNRLRSHLEKCALVYGCPAAKNFFLERFEAPLPTSKTCNAKCIGCISKNEKVANCQERINFTPSPIEISEIAIEHIKNVKNAIVSFGQGCEGDPIFSADVIEPAIQMIRFAHKNGTINMNTNASNPDVIEKLINAGLDSIRVSLNSVREPCYNKYFRPKNYKFENVLRSIDIAIAHKKFVSINYLNLPGFTDSQEEFEALISFIEKHRINMIQWRNLNFDPKRYWEIMDNVSNHYKPIGIKKVLKEVKNKFPWIKFGYFNPSTENFKDL